MWQCDDDFAIDLAFLRANLRADLAKDLDHNYANFLSVRAEPSRDDQFRFLDRFATLALERHWRSVSDEEKQALGKIRLRCAPYVPTYLATAEDIAVEFPSLIDREKQAA